METRHTAVPASIEAPGHLKPAQQRPGPRTCIDPIAIPIPVFCDTQHIGHSKLYELIDAGEIDSVLIGRRRYVILDSYRAYLERLKHTQVAGIGKIASPNPRANRAQPSTTTTPTIADGRALPAAKPKNAPPVRDKSATA